MSGEQSASADLSAIVEFLGRAFPSLASLPPAEGLRRAESLGLYAASIWSVGPQALAARNVHVPPDVHARLAQAAAATAHAARGGAVFLTHLRGALQDQRFAPVIVAIGTHFARASANAMAQGSGTQAALATASVPGAAQPPAQPPAAEPAPEPEPAPGPDAQGDEGGEPGAPGAGREGGTGRLTLREIGGFELVKLLGEGGMGKVFKARQKSLDRYVALKVLSPQLALDSEYVDRFKREAIAAAALHHQNIVGVIEHGTDKQNGMHFIAFEFIEGMTVEGMLKAKQKFGEREALATCRAVASALACAEQAGIVHRDIKPDNIIVGRDGIPRVVDLGLAKKQDDKSAMTVVGVVMGTPQYMAPEQALGEAVIDHRADIYALGMTLYRLVTGKLAFDAESSTGILMKHITDDCPDPRLADPSVSVNVARIILKLSAREKDARYQSAAEVIRDIDQVLAGKPPLLAPPLGAPGQKAPPQGTSGRAPAVRRTDIPVPDDPPWTTEIFPAAIQGAQQPPPKPISDPVGAAVAHFERTGDQSKITEAVTRLTGMAQRLAADPQACAKVETQLARINLARGDRAAAEKHAQNAMEKDAGSVEAYDIQARAARGEGGRLKLEGTLASAREAITAGRLDDARRIAERLHESNPGDPHPYLLGAVVARLTGDQRAFVDGVKNAWARFPSKDRPEATFGGLDGLVADLLASHGRSAFRDPALMNATVSLEGLDDKQNLTAGALRMAAGIARAALERGDLTTFMQRRLRLAIARALTALRKYDAATEELARVVSLAPSDLENKVIDAERGFIQHMRAREEKAGRAGQGRLRCPTLTALLEQASARAAAAQKDAGLKAAEIDKLGAQLAELSQKDPAVRKEVRRAAEQLAIDDPFEHLEPLERDLAEVARERARGAGPKEEKKEGGFLSKLKDVAAGAAAGVAGAAHSAQLKIKENLLKGKHDAAVKSLALTFARQLRDFDYTHPKVKPLARKAAALGVAMDWAAAEEARARKDVERLSGQLFT